MRTRTISIRLAAILALVTAPAARAQQAAIAPPAFAGETVLSTGAASLAPPAARGPAVGALSVGIRPAAARPDAPSADAARATAAAASHGGMGQPAALMIVGGAAMIAGAVVEGDAGRLLLVGGAVIGLVGLYEYLK